ncbi:peptide-methionine (S)-S-oxide reductase MsrA [Rubricoccus marinus]|uniref:Peptide methionine sulfoxide reductase MsrA n=1 Tax=Rubricoccus marinus TaxID=716817 RepID=A0A259TXA0_9BACT|nr:peptide-methionine (S)-S-oxide reductase MsrA [Rubricoccus marinus]OZC02385.1 peptide-methionine (S)-S-oxide reductase [Rubricoccus marinus]
MATTETATLGGGCFWCTEAVLEKLRGVKSVTSGYAGGKIPNPSYREICTGLTGHAEVVRVEFDPDVISYADLLRVFFATHDPTTLNQQGADRGTQYRSTIMYDSEEHRKTAEAVIEELKDTFDRPIVTEVVEEPTFYPAEDYHQEYYRSNPGQPYCQAVIAPKVAKLRAHYLDKLAA